MRMIFTAFLGASVDNESAGATVANPEDSFNILAIARYTTMAMEFLFILLPLRHNFVYHNIEM